MFPFSDFSLPLFWDRNLSALISMSEDCTSRITREKAPPYPSNQARLLARSLTDANTVDAFFDQQGFGKLFILEDKVRNIRKAGWSDSPIRHEGNDECAIDLSLGSNADWLFAFTTVLSSHWPRPISYTSCTDYV
jgi:hypothetical protein